MYGKDCGAKSKCADWACFWCGIEGFEHDFLNTGFRAGTTSKPDF